MEAIGSKEYNQWLSVIRVANETNDKEALRSIQKQLIVKYGMENRDVQYLIGKFKFTV